MAYRIETELADSSRSRQARRTARAKWGSLLRFNAFAGVLGLMLFFSFQELRTLQTADPRDYEYEAEITERLIPRQGTEREDLEGETLVFHYNTRQGKQHAGTVVVNRGNARYVAYKGPGSRLRILLVPGTTGEYYLGTLKNYRTARSAGRVFEFLVALIVGTVIVRAFEERTRLHLFLLQHGVAAPGVIDAHKRADQKGRFLPIAGITGLLLARFTFLSYYFATLSGRTLHPTIPVSGPVFGALKEGETVTILYDPKNPSRSLPYRVIQSERQAELLAMADG